MHWKSQLRPTQQSKLPALDSSLDLESLFSDSTSHPNLVRFLKIASDQKQSLDQSLEAALSASKRELTTLLREIDNSSNAAPTNTPQSQPSSELLMRAVQCAVKQHVLQTELCSLALTDELAGLYNRRGFLCLAERQLKLAARSGRDMLLFFIDIDGLKRINDSFGHCEGDAAMIRVAKILKRTFRESDVLARLGGDEFAALAIEAAGHSEDNIMARLHQHLESTRAHESRYLLSLSVGVVPFTPPTTSSLAELMCHADRAMYRAKKNKRKSTGDADAKDSPENSTAPYRPQPLINVSRMLALAHQRATILASRKHTSSPGT
jgi:diguanylate cyclase (GGDEF)-like protein